MNFIGGMTMKKTIKSIAMAMCVIILISTLPLVINVKDAKAAYTYDVNAAMSYAAAHYRDKRDSSNWEWCATFVSKCVKAGGINIPGSDNTLDCYNQIRSATGVDGVDLKLDGNGYATSALNGNILSRGDVVIQWCNTHNLRPHILICSGYNSSGSALFYANNNPMANSTYRLKPYTYQGHTAACDMVAKVLHISQPTEVKPGTQVVPNGDYLICSADHSNGVFFLDVDGLSTSPANGTNVAIWGPLTVQPGVADAWTLTYSNGFYSIKQKGTNMALDIDGAQTHATANAWLYASNGGSAQQWKITPNGIGYRLQARCSGLSLDIDGAQMKPGTNVQQYYDNDSAAQRWILIPYKAGQPISIKSLNPTDIIKNVKITDLSPSGYTVTCELANYAISKVIFPTWTVPNGQDDLFQNWGETTKGTISGNRVTYRVNTSQHKNENGCDYITHIYAHDYFGNTVCVDQNKSSNLLVRVPAKQIVNPTVAPTAKPTTKPVKPTSKPTAKPTSKPANKPTTKPSVSLVLDKSSATVVCGKSLSLVATLKGSNASINWKTSDPNIATVDSSGKISAKMAGSVTITATAVGKSVSCRVQVLYKDVINAKNFWFEPTNYLTNNGVVKGYNKQTQFKPANKCTRAQMVTFIWRLEGCPEPASQTCKFKDVKKSNYFYKACIWGNEQGIVEGYKNGTFGPKITCARKHAVTFLWRLAGEPEPNSYTNKFKDVKKKDYFYTATLWASENGILAGYNDGTFRPSGDCLRRQMVTFLYKYDKFVNDKG